MKNIHLSKSGRSIIVDDEDYPLLSRLSWYLRVDENRVYTTVGGKSVQISRLLVSTAKGEEVDHINRNPLDNRKKNLRVCTRIQNEMNKPVRKGSKSGLKGVRLVRNSWVARIKINRKFLHIGCFKSKEDAARAYNEKAKEIYGEFAWLNPV